MGFFRLHIYEDFDLSDGVCFGLHEASYKSTIYIKDDLIDTVDEITINCKYAHPTDLDEQDKNIDEDGQVSVLKENRGKYGYIQEVEKLFLIKNGEDVYLSDEIIYFDYHEINLDNG